MFKAILLIVILLVHCQAAIVLVPITFVDDEPQNNGNTNDVTTDQIKVPSDGQITNTTGQGLTPQITTTTNTTEKLNDTIIVVKPIDQVTSNLAQGAITTEVKPTQPNTNVETIKPIDTVDSNIQLVDPTKTQPIDTSITVTPIDNANLNTEPVYPDTTTNNPIEAPKKCDHQTHNHKSKPVFSNLLINGNFQQHIVKERTFLAPGWLLVSASVVNGSTVYPKWNSQIAILKPNPIISSLKKQVAKHVKFTQPINFITQDVLLKRPLKLKLSFKAGIVSQVLNTNTKSLKTQSPSPLKLQVMINNRKLFFMIKAQSGDYSIDFTGIFGRNSVTFSNVNEFVVPANQYIALDDIKLQTI